MTASTPSNPRPDVTASAASEMMVRVRTASQGAMAPEEVAELRDALEPKIVACNHWLGLLREWVQRGLLVEAASVNDSYPELCKVAHLLAMPDDRLGWDQACNRAGIAPNSRIDEQAYLELSDAIADASSLDEFVQRFQIAVLGRKPLPARIKALQGLLSAAPRNDAVRGLAKRFESEALAGLEEGCRTAAAQGRHDELADALEAIEGLGWGSQFSNEFLDWLRSEIDRRNRREAAAKFEALAPRIEAAYAARDLMLVGTLCEELEQVERDHATSPADSVRRRTRDAMEWAEAERSRLRAESELAAQCEAMRRALDQGYAYPELEPIRGRILSLGLGVPGDIEARFETAHASWRAGRRRRAATVVGVAVLAVSSVIAVIAYLSWQRSEYQRAEEVGARIASLLSDGDFAQARIMLDKVRESEPWMLEVPAVGTADARLQYEGPRYDSRRQAIAELLSRAQGADRNDAEALEASLSVLSAALDKTAMLERPTSDEARALRQQRQAIVDAIVEIKTRARKQREEEFADLQRVLAGLPPSTERSAPDRLSADATEKYLRDVRAAEQRVREFVQRAPGDDPNRAMAQTMLDRLAKDAAAAEKLVPDLRDAARLLDRLKVTPSSESEYLATLDQLSSEPFAGIAAASDGQRGAAIADAGRMARAATALEHWRTQVLPTIKASNANDALMLPSRRQEAAALSAALQSHIDAHPASPYGKIAQEWRAICERAAASKQETAAQDALESLDATGLPRLRQVSLKGNRWAFVREDGVAKGTLSGLVQTLQDLTCPPGQLRTNLDLVQQHSGARQPTPWSRAIDAAKERLLAANAVDVKVQWLRMMAAVRATPEVTEDMARAMVLFRLWAAFDEHLAAEGSPDADLAKKLEGFRRSETAFLNCDWPRLSIKPPGDVERQAQQGAARRLINALPDFGKEADQRERDFLGQRETAKSATLVGVLLPKSAGEDVRRCSPADLNGEGYQVLSFDPKTQSWTFQTASFDKGTLKSGASGAPAYSLIYIRK